MEPNRWLHIRHPEGFSPVLFDQFRVHCQVMQAYVHILLDHWNEIGVTKESAPKYIFFEPELSEDRTVATLPIGGEWDLISRATIENGCSRMLWQFLPIFFSIHLEEGLTEYMPETFESNTPVKLHTNWRKAVDLH